MRHVSKQKTRKNLFSLILIWYFKSLCHWFIIHYYSLFRCLNLSKKYFSIWHQLIIYSILYSIDYNSFFRSLWIPIILQLSCCVVWFFFVFYKYFLRWINIFLDRLCGTATPWSWWTRAACTSCTSATHTN